MAFKIFGRKRKKKRKSKKKRKKKKSSKKSKKKNKYYCTKCNRNHTTSSKIGKRHKKFKRKLKKKKKPKKTKKRKSKKRKKRSKKKVKPLINKMPDEKAYKLLGRYRVKTPTHAFCKNEKELEKSLKKVGFPCAMKVSGPEIVHKTEVNGVRLNIETKEEAVKTFKELIEIKGCEKVLVQEMITKGYEIIVGGRKDPQFGRVIALGAGGVFTEFLKDVSFRVPPINRENAEEMLMEVRFSDLILKGFRGKKPAKKKPIVDTILAVSRIMKRYPKIKEMDINPLFASSENSIAADIRVILE